MNQILELLYLRMNFILLSSLHNCRRMTSQSRVFVAHLLLPRLPNAVRTLILSRC